MPIAAWPDDVNQNTQRSSFSESPEKNSALFQPEVGPPKERRRSSISTDIFNGLVGLYTSDEWDSLINFYRVTLSDGVRPFSRNHPRTFVPMTFKFIGDPPKITGMDGLMFVGSFNLRRMP